MDYTFDVICVVFVIFTMLYVIVKKHKSAPLPPGPRKLPFIGNLLDMPTELEYMKFREWSSTYGPVMYLSAGRTKLLVLNTLEAARDLLEKRSVKYSNRPHLTMLMDVIGWDWSVALMNLGKKFSKHRRIIHKGLTANVRHFQEIQEQETAQLIINLSEKPTDFMELIEFWAKAITLRITYGYRPSSNDDHYIWLAQQCANAISETGRPGAFLVDSLPFLRWVPDWIPGAGFKQKAAVWGALVKEVLESPMQYAVDNLHKFAIQKSYVGALLQMDSQDTLGKSNEIQAIKETAAIVHTAGSESVFSLLQSFVLAMTLYPDVQTKALEEITAVIRKSRLPNFSDRLQLPYVEKVFLETMRWSRPVPLGIAHQSASDDIYLDMFIPAGTIIMTNIWSITRNTNLYDNPEDFIPERFDDPNAPDPRNYIFGFGRRVCAGKAVAESSLWLGIVTILSQLEISRALNENRREIMPEVEYTPGLVIHPKPFRCIIKPREI